MTFFKLTHLLIILSIFSQSLMAASSVSFEHEAQSAISISENIAGSHDHQKQDQQCHMHGHCHHLHFLSFNFNNGSPKNIEAVFYSIQQPMLSNTVLQNLYRPPKA